MKKYCLIAIFIMVLSSCAQVYFTQPQPQKGTTVKSFLDEYTGVYADSILDIVIDKAAITVSSDRFELTKKNPTAHQVVVKYYKDFYFASFKDSSYFSVYMAKFFDDKLAVYMLNADELSIGRINRIVRVDTIDVENEHFLIDPSKTEFEELVDYGLFEVVNVLEKVN